MKTINTFTPDYAIAPGVTLRETLESMSISQTDLAMRTGMTEKTISQIVNGSAPITYETARKLELVLGIPASFWNNRESQYRETLLRLEEAEKLGAEKTWLKNIPVKELVNRGYLSATADKGSLVREVFKFFQVSSVEAWVQTWLVPQVQFRGSKAQADHPGYVAAWIRIGEILAHKIECRPYEEQKFRVALDSIRGLVTQASSVWEPKLKSLCATAGVAVVLVREIPSAGVCGATKWLGKDKAVIMLSLKYKSDDQFWFSFFHEACHVLKHSKKKAFYETGKPGDSVEEKEANQFAADILIPPKFSKLLHILKSESTILDFARKIGVSPGIVVGRLQHDKFLKPSFFNDLKRKYAWKS